MDDFLDQQEQSFINKDIFNIFDVIDEINQNSLKEIEIESLGEEEHHKLEMQLEFINDFEEIISQIIDAFDQQNQDLLNQLLSRIDLNLLNKYYNKVSQIITDSGFAKIIVQLVFNPDIQQILIENCFKLLTICAQHSEETTQLLIDEKFIPFFFQNFDQMNDIIIHCGFIICGHIIIDLSDEIYNLIVNEDFTQFIRLRMERNGDTFEPSLYYLFYAISPRLTCAKVADVYFFVEMILIFSKMEIHQSDTFLYISLFYLVEHFQNAYLIISRKENIKFILDKIHSTNETHIMITLSLWKNIVQRCPNDNFVNRFLLFSNFPVLICYLCKQTQITEIILKYVNVIASRGTKFIYILLNNNIIQIMIQMTSKMNFKYLLLVLEFLEIVVKNGTVLEIIDTFQSNCLNFLLDILDQEEEVDLLNRVFELLIALTNIYCMGESKNKFLEEFQNLGGFSIMESIENISEIGSEFYNLISNMSIDEEFL